MSDIFFTIAKLLRRVILIVAVVGNSLFWDFDPWAAWLLVPLLGVLYELVCMCMESALTSVIARLEAKLSTIRKEMERRGLVGV